MRDLSSIVPAPRFAATTRHYFIKRLMENSFSGGFWPKIYPVKILHWPNGGLFSFVYRSLFICIQVSCVHA